MASTTFVVVFVKDIGLTTEELETTMKDKTVSRSIMGVWPRSTLWVNEWVDGWMTEWVSDAKKVNLRCAELS